MYPLDACFLSIRANLELSLEVLIPQSEFLQKYNVTVVSFKMSKSIHQGILTHHYLYMYISKEVFIKGTFYVRCMTFLNFS